MFIVLVLDCHPILLLVFDALLGSLFHVGGYFHPPRFLLMAKSSSHFAGCIAHFGDYFYFGDYCLYLNSDFIQWFLLPVLGRIVILLSLMILAILGHFELWALSFSPWCSRMLTWLTFFFLVLIGIVFLVSSCSSYLFHQESVILLMGLIHSRKGLSFLVRVPSVLVGFCGFWFCGCCYYIFSFSGPCSFRHGYVVIRWLVSLLTVGVLCFSACVLSWDHWQVKGIKVVPFLTPIFPSGILANQRYTCDWVLKDAFQFAGVVYHVK